MRLLPNAEATVVAREARNIFQRTIYFMVVAHGVARNFER